ncbi:MAG: Uncharacterised protein [Cellulomonadaceae bacterium TMED98]|nr:MAG: Uncharacterised protein [Cellulomonadaceae bacterium TMED98]
MRRFLFSSSLISALASGASVVRQTVRGPRDWKLILLWASWLISVVLAVTSVLEREKR